MWATSASSNCSCVFSFVPAGAALGPFFTGILVSYGWLVVFVMLIVSDLIALMMALRIAFRSRKSSKAVRVGVLSNLWCYLRNLGCVHLFKWALAPISTASAFHVSGMLHNSFVATNSIQIALWPLNNLNVLTILLRISQFCYDLCVNKSIHCVVFTFELSHTVCSILVF